MKIESIPHLLIRVGSYVSDAELDRAKRAFREAFPHQRAIFYRGDEVEITPIMRRERGKYLPSLKGHVG